MTNALNALRLRWRNRQESLSRQARASPSGVEREHLKHEWTVLNGCVQELLDTVTGVRPLPLNEVSTEKLYRWAPQILQILDLAIEAQKSGDERVEAIGHELATVVGQVFLNDIYDLFKQLANRGTK
jgi:hypothetical protein